MTSEIKHWVSDLFIYSDEQFVGCRNWGFTIYRTEYGPSSEPHWQQLLQTIQVGAHKGALEITETTEEDPSFQQLWSLFRLDARSDPALAGLSIDQLRDLYNSGEGSQLMNKDYELHQIFLFADDEDLLDPAILSLNAEMPTTVPRTIFHEIGE